MQNTDKLKLDITWGEFKQCLMFLQEHPDPELDFLRDIIEEKFLSMQAKEIYQRMKFTDMPLEARTSLIDEYNTLKGKIDSLKYKRGLKS